jgi:hypothetical protein
MKKHDHSFELTGAAGPYKHGYLRGYWAALDDVLKLMETLGEDWDTSE